MKPTSPDINDGSFMGHPKGLAYIIFTEAWERFSFYGMQALMVLYMSTHLFQDGTIETVVGISHYKSFIEGIFGELTVRGLATQTFGLYIGLTFLLPVFGGLIGDKWLGQSKAVLAGAVLMMIGHFVMAFETLFLFAVILLITGAGLLKGNLAAQVGALYEKDDQRVDTAFSVYSVAINVGAAVAPLVCGTLGEIFGWHYGFGVAGLGMLVSIAIYISGLKYIPDVKKEESVGENAPLEATDKSKIWLLSLLFVVTSLFWVAQTQVWNTYPLWIKDNVDLIVFGLQMPVTWFQALDSIAVLTLAPIILFIWKKQRNRDVEPKEITKVIAGFSVFAFACFWLAIGQTFSEDGKVSVFWPALFHFFCAVGYLYSWPAVMAIVSKSAPQAVNSMMIGALYISVFVGSITSGWLGRFYEQIPPADFWLMHGLIVAAGAVVYFLLRPVLINVLELGKIDKSQTA